VSQNPKPGFTGSPINRSDKIRMNADALAAARAHPDARFLPLMKLDPHLLDERLLWLTPEQVPDEADMLFLGIEQDAPRFAVDLSASQLSTEPLTAHQAIARISAEEAASYAGARSLMDWHARHRHCPACGTATEMRRGGWMRTCPGCGAEQFPRVDPVVIMLAEHEGQVLVGRQPRFPPQSYSALAGFIEVGESIEEAVARELHEEAGVTATDVRYVVSQPWPFPSSLMIGCFAQVTGRDIVIDEDELEAAMWVSRDEVRAALNGDGRFRTAPPYALAHTLLSRWAAEG